MSVTAMHHVGILVDGFDDVQRLLGDVLGVRCDPPVAEDELGIEIMWAHVGGVDLEFIRPLHDDARAAAALRSGEGGVHHVALVADDASAALAALRERVTADPAPRAGAHGTRIAFAHIGPVRIELVDNQGSSRT